MSLENQVAVLSQNVGNLVNRVTTQANAWDAQVAQAQQTVNNYVANAKNLSYNIEMRSFTVGGSVDLFYPVVFTAPGRRPIVLQIYRHYVHLDASWHGSLFFELHYFSYSWGEGSSYLRLAKHLFAQKQFVARYTASVAYHIIVWLRGQTTYDWSCSHFSTSVDYSAGPKTIDYGNGTSDTYNVINAVDTDLQTQYFGFGR